MPEPLLMHQLDPDMPLRHIPSEERMASFLKVVKATGLDFDGEDLKRHEGGRYIVIAYDGELGIFREADTLQDLAGCIGGLLDVAYAYGGWYDLDDETPHTHGASWVITVNHGDDYDTAEGDLLV
jgi:hypothetical protein